MKIGIDFDNTIVCYDRVFQAVAREKQLFSSDIVAAKGPIRDYLRSIGQEEVWTELQGYVYGPGMEFAEPFPGVLEFFETCRKEDIEVCIVSHKTLHPYRGPKYDLHLAAREWLAKQNFFNASVEAYFELTLEDKLQRIGGLSCDYFIDDLPEVLLEKNFPVNIGKILFDPLCQYNQRFDCIEHLKLWSDIREFIRNRCATFRST